MLRKLVAGFGNRRINAAVSNDLFEQPMDELFGSRSESLRAEVAKLHGHERELAIVKAAGEELSENVGHFVQRFRFVMWRPRTTYSSSASTKKATPS